MDSVILIISRDVKWYFVQGPRKNRKLIHVVEEKFIIALGQLSNRVKFYILFQLHC